MNVESLQVGDRIKNYPTLCRIIKEPIIRGGNALKYQLIELSRYVKYHKEGRAFVIDEVYEEPLDKQSNSTYKDLLPLLLDLLSMEQIETKQNHLGLTKKALLYSLGFTNMNYDIGFQDQYTVIHSEKYENKTAVLDFFSSTRDRAYKTVIYHLNKLKEKKVLDYKYGFKVNLKDTKQNTWIDLTIDSDLDYMLNCESRSKDKLGISDEDCLSLNDFRNINRETVDLINKEKHFKDVIVVGYYRVVSIVLFDNFKTSILSSEDRESKKKQINESFANSANKTAMKLNDKKKQELQELKKNSIGIIKLSKKGDMDRIKESYITNTKELVKEYIKR